VLKGFPEFESVILRVPQSLNQSLRYERLSRQKLLLLFITLLLVRLGSGGVTDIEASDRFCDEVKATDRETPGR
jgi:hypothetical protein